ncbi:uncharacterized protein K441DRAFT_679780 [Cenococcum geophilum 1.58]|uniref:uncharacterized protein n=1 Tax=Cenococcum geophilum 1.58 TaxID=794803 RepID=UPI0035901DAD|nr:hypothetical protein K441DRAFT_679780 [Cenococcum geophilum 1.58]
MDTQLDRVVIQNILQPLRQEVLKMLQEKISKKKRGDWFETPGRGSRFEDYRLIEPYFHSAQTLIAHFRDSFHGQVPFTKDWVSPEMPKLAEVNIEEAAFMGKLKDHLTQRKNSYEQLKHGNRYENLLYWAHQLFFDTWDPTQVYIKEMNEQSARNYSSCVLECVGTL